MPDTHEQLTAPSSRSRVRLAATILLVGALAALPALAQIKSHPEVSFVDEFAHFDYVDKVAHGEIARPRTLVGQNAMREEACRGMLGGVALPPCRTDRDYKYDPADFQFGGLSSAGEYPPLYYGVTAGIALVFDATLPLRDPWGLLTAARLATALWLIGGCIVLWFAARPIIPSPLGRSAVIMLLASSPMVLMGTAHVNNDAPSILIGAIALLLILRETRESPPHPLVRALFGVAVALVKLTHVVAVVAVVVAVLTDARRSMRRRLAAAATYVVPAALLHVVWYGIQRIREGDDEGIPAGTPDGANLDQLVYQAMSLFPPQNGTTALMHNTEFPSIIASQAAIVSLVMTICAGVCLGWYLFPGVGGRMSQMVPARAGFVIAAATVVSSVAFPLMVTFSQLPVLGSYSQYISRYGLAVFPLWVVILGIVASQRPRLLQVFAGFAVLSYVALLANQLRVIPDIVT